jgi:trk system potassium uptake protein TrkA
VWEDRAVHVIVVGCGRVGSGLAVALDRDGHSVAIIDNYLEAFRMYLPFECSGRGLHGFVF